MSVNEVKIKRAPTAFELRGTGPPTSRTFVLGDEDHTLGNALRHVLIEDARVDFAGYCVPHPSEPVVHLRVQSRVIDPANNKGAGRSTAGGGDDEDEMLEEGGDISLTAIEALKEACATLSNQCDLVLEKLEEAAPEVKGDKERMDRLAEEDRLNEEEMEDEEMMEDDLVEEDE
mmetsp:Transcript_22938/g.39249  ORF Transcript_22938/g.39249 Transcript_22938/m.39249 type:complete len:174 (+) Transcript_22938:76-597(+)|eukprot:CAMPEP_0183713946 /NCGR_PEP_ID=MMETSP0737-20130205/8670_1 /TAXON_ID=385413 /ORGANISM="Thalassiosira miniscula, Strain CCMP1093" /LENGTH=173 /DNA_ID=CAMNT_0025942831 /DNA_START=599 /DNA_END=1123 /DNA_ORIENTATION=-